MSRIVAGVIGWLVGTVPLVVVNIVSVENLLDQRASLAWGAVALLGGIALGGVAAGAFGARAERGGSERGGDGPVDLVSAGLAGGLAALLFVATLLGLLVGASRLGIAPALIATHPIRVVLAIVCLAALLVLIALLAGALVSRLEAAPEAAAAGGRSAGQPPARYAPSMPRTARGPHAHAHADAREFEPRGAAERPYSGPAAPYRPGPPSRPVAPRPASDARPDPRYRPPSGPAPRSVPRPPTAHQDPPRR